VLGRGKSLFPCEYLAVSCNLQGFSSAWQGYLTHSCHPVIFSGLYQPDMPLPSKLLCRWCSICRLSRIFLLLGLPCPCDSFVMKGRREEDFYKVLLNEIAYRGDYVYSFRKLPLSKTWFRKWLLFIYLSLSHTLGTRRRECHPVHLM
jgi:hypothetical protein